MRSKVAEHDDNDCGGLGGLLRHDTSELVYVDIDPAHHVIKIDGKKPRVQFHVDMSRNNKSEYVFTLTDGSRRPIQLDPLVTRILEAIALGR